MPLKNFLLSIICTLVLFSCTNSEDPTKIIPGIPEGTNLRINFYRQFCFGEGRFQCLQVQEGEQLGTDTWFNFFGGIEGFEYEGGFVYNLEVRTRTIENPPADGSSIAYELVRIISREAIACQFDNPIQDLPWLEAEVAFRIGNPTEESQYCYITQATLDGHPFFIYRDCNPFINKIDPVYTCFGEFLGFMGGDGIDFASLSNEALVWSPNAFGCSL